MSFDPRAVLRALVPALALLIVTCVPISAQATDPSQPAEPAKDPGEQLIGPRGESPEGAEPTPPDSDAEPDNDDAAEAEQEAAKEPWIDRWARFRGAARDISYIDFKEGMFRGRVGLRFQIDGTLGKESDDLEELVGDIDRGIGMRRLRVYADGDFFRRYHYRFEYDFAEDKGLKDAYVDDLFRQVFKYFSLAVGNIQEPFSLENMGSSNFNGFMENSLPVATIAPGRNFGYLLHGSHHKNRVTWRLGMFTNSQTTDDNRSSSDFTTTGRATGLPLLRENGRKLVHVGLSASVRNPKGGVVRYASRPEARFAPFFIATPELSASENRLYGLEFALIHGPWWSQVEWVEASPNTDLFGRLRFQGGYAEVGYFLTGEHRAYNHANGTVGRLQPNRDYSLGGNPFKKGSNGGAIELAVRLSTMDLSDRTLVGGEMVNMTFGMNWYLTRATRFEFNYIRSEVKDLGNANIVLLRYSFNPGYSWPLLHPKRNTLWPWVAEMTKKKDKETRKEEKRRRKEEKKRQKEADTEEAPSDESAGAGVALLDVRGDARDR